MKTTVKLTPAIRATVSPVKTGGVLLEIAHAPENPIISFHLTLDQCGALMFGIEQAIEAAEIASARGSEELLNLG